MMGEQTARSSARAGTAIRAKNAAYLCLWKLRTLRTRRKAAGMYDPNRTYWIRPEDVTLSLDVPGGIGETGERQSAILERGLIADGDWDLKAFPFEQMDVWRAFCERFRDGVKWQDTEWYARQTRRLRKGRCLWGCATVEAFEDRLAEVERLFEDIKTNGFRTQSELNDEQARPFGDEDEVQVHIGRDGDYIFADGRHRLCIARILGLDRIPVKVARRHKRWVAFRREILSYAEGQKGRVYSPLTHPDLADIPSIHSDKRMTAMQEHLPSGGGTMLDIGAHWGYFCHRFEELGFHCTAVENAGLNLYFLKKLRRAQRRRFDLIEDSVLEAKFARPFDVVLGLNIFHHFLKRQELCEKLIALLGRLDAKVMFLEPHRPDEPQMRGAYRNPGPEEFVAFVQEHGGFRSATELATVDYKRRVFKLER